MSSGQGETVVVKIGGSTLGSHDTTLEDVAELRRRGLSPVVVHGGGALISEWLRLTGVPTRFEGGLRVTDAESLEVVVAVLAGLVNKQLVAALEALGREGDRDEPARTAACCAAASPMLLSASSARWMRWTPAPSRRPSKAGPCR